MKDWTQMQPELFDVDAKPVQEALFAAPDKCGTPDLFDSAEIPADSFAEAVKRYQVLASKGCEREEAACSAADEYHVSALDILDATRG